MKNATSKAKTTKVFEGLWKVLGWNAYLVASTSDWGSGWELRVGEDHHDATWVETFNTKRDALETFLADPQWAGATREQS